MKADLQKHKGVDTLAVALTILMYCSWKARFPWSMQMCKMVVVPSIICLKGVVIDHINITSDSGIRGLLASLHHINVGDPEISFTLIATLSGRVRVLYTTEAGDSTSQGNIG